MKLISLAVLFSSVEAIRYKASMPTGAETLCVMRRTGKLDIENTWFKGKKWGEHRDGGFNAIALAQTSGDDEKKEDDAKPVLDETAFERWLQRNMGNNACLVYTAEF